MDHRTSLKISIPGQLFDKNTSDDIKINVEITSSDEIVKTLTSCLIQLIEKDMESSSKTTKKILKKLDSYDLILDNIINHLERRHLKNKSK